MSERITVKDPSPLVKAVLALDEYFSELQRLGNKITEMELKTDFDFEQAHTLLARFAECGQGVATEVVKLSTFLAEARAQAETTAQAVSTRAEFINSRKNEEQKKFEEFRLLGEKVRELSTTMAKWKRSDGQELNDLERAELSASLVEFEAQLDPLIEQAQNLRNEANAAKMKTLAQNAESLTQTLQAIRAKLGTIHLPVH